MDLVKLVLLYLTMVVSAATGVSPDVTPIPASQVATPAPYVTVTPDPQSLITPAPTAAPTQARYITLILNDEGSNVRRLQRRLVELGYLDSGSVDGKYGPKTKKAVEQFQKKNGLRVDGIAGSQTQQLMFESPYVIYYNSATPTPIPTATPIPYVSVPVYYVDAATNTVLSSSNASCFASTYISADGTKVPAGYTLVSNSPVQVTVRSGVASPSSVTFYYQGPSSSVTVPVYYVDENNVTVAQSSIRLSKSGYVYADSSMLPAGCVFSSATSVYVTVSGGKASTNMIVFRVARSVTAAPRPTERVKAAVTVQYLDAMTGGLLYQTTVSMYSSSKVYARDSVVPAGYQRVSDSSVSVAVQNGQANPSLVQFFYSNPSVTATPAPSVTVPVYYIDAQTSRILVRGSVQLTRSTRVYRETAMVPAGYEISGSTSVYVTVSNGVANPASVVFRVQQKATPAPTVPTYVDVLVRYNYGSTTLYSVTVPCRTGQTSQIYADSSLYGPSYVLSSTSSNPKKVTVSASGIANPSTVTFYLAKAATATPIRYVSVPVRYMYGNRIITSGTVSCPAGKTTTIVADSSLYPSTYVLSGNSRVNVKVSSAGVVSPSAVIFNLALAPTPVPSFTVDVSVRYVYGTTVVATGYASCKNGVTTKVYADASAYDTRRYVISGSSSANVYVSVSGTASPSAVTFYLAAKATATPTAVPKYNVKVPVRYMYNGRTVVDGIWECPTGETTAIYADQRLYGDEYELSGSNVVYVTVSSRGTANPKEVVFSLVRKATAVPKYNVEVPVRYMCDGQVVIAGTEECMTGETTAIYAQPRLYEKDYVLNGSNVVYVNVSVSGAANPSEVIFSLSRKATPVPQYNVKVPVRYMYNGRTVVDGVWECPTGETTAIYADQRLYGDEFELSGSNVVYVTVSAKGTANPKEVVFNLTRRATPTPEPTAVPVLEVEVPVQYVYGRNRVFEYTTVCYSGQDNVVYADPEVYGSTYVLSGPDRQTVRVSSRGVATPDVVIFYLDLAATPEPTAVPSFRVEVPVRYLLNGRVIFTETARCMSDMMTDVTANFSLFSGQYTLAGPDTVTVYVSADGAAQPSVVEFYLEEEREPEPEPEPEPVGPVYPPAPRGGGLDRALPDFVELGFGNTPLNVYFGPNEKYYRTDSAVFYGEQARVYGKQDDWLLISYPDEEGNFRFGYVHDYLLTTDISSNRMPKPKFANIQTTVTDRVSVTDAPETGLGSFDTIPAGTKVTFLLWLYDGSDWAMIEYQSPDLKKPVRAFVPGRYLACMQ